MTFTLEDVLKLEVMKLCTVHTASQLIGQVHVKGVSFVEVPVDHYVRENDLVLSTAIGCGHNSELFFKFVSDLIATKASALVVATGRYIHEIPSDSLQLANQNQFPIIEIPWEVRFSDINLAVMNHIHQLHTSILRNSEDAQKHILNLFMRGANLSSFAKFIQKELKSPVLIVNKEGVISGKSLMSDHFSQLYNEYIWSLDKPLTNNPTLKQLLKYSQFN